MKTRCSEAGKLKESGELIQQAIGELRAVWSSKQQLEQKIQEHLDTLTWQANDCKRLRGGSGRIT